MRVLASIAYLTGVAIGLRLDIRMTISATIIVLLFAFGLRLIGFAGTADTLFGALATIAALQSGYVSIVVLNAFGIIETVETARRPALTPPSASDNP
jgi:hypothetical protein